jgi:hypothetical protein
MSMQWLPKLRAHAHNNWHRLVTGDGGWLHHEYIRDRIWTVQKENNPEMANRTIASRKSILTVWWNPRRFHVLTMLPPGASFNSSWFIDQDLVPLLDRFFPDEWDPRQRELVAFLDNSAPTMRRWLETASRTACWKDSHSHHTHPIAFYRITDCKVPNFFDFQFCPSYWKIAILFHMILSKNAKVSLSDIFDANNGI